MNVNGQIHVQKEVTDHTILLIRDFPSVHKSGLPSCRVAAATSYGELMRRSVPCRSVPGETVLNTVPYFCTLVCNNWRR